jgi:hypothetical protein
MGRIAAEAAGGMMEGPGWPLLEEDARGFLSGTRCTRVRPALRMPSSSVRGVRGRTGAANGALGAISDP